jgi:hypothetical protein
MIFQLPARLEVRTNRVHRHLDLRTHDLVPSIYGLNQEARVLPAPCPAEGVCEGGIGRKIYINRLALDRRR